VGPEGLDAGGADLSCGPIIDRVGSLAANLSEDFSLAPRLACSCHDGRSTMGWGESVQRAALGNPALLGSCGRSSIA
jgi:hypothetical protein